MGPGAYYLGNDELNNLRIALENRELSRYNSQRMSFVDAFEHEVSSLFEIDYVLGMNSCTSALYSGIKALHLNKGDEVIVPCFTFVATIAAVVLNGLVPVFANIDESLSIDPKDIESRITNKTKAIIAVHMLGNPCNMESITILCQKHNLMLIEDFAQAFGGSYQKKRVGTFGIFGASSLNMFKIITAGDGGVFLTNDEKLYNGVFSFHDHGFYESNNRIITEDSVFGLNLRMHELTGCVAFGQIRKLELILSNLRNTKSIFKSVLGDSSKYRYRTINDPEGDCAQVVVLEFESVKLADEFCKQNHTKTLFSSQKHCYPAMIQILKKEIDRYPYSTEYLQKSGDILQRSIVLSIGMKDSYIGSDIGTSIQKSDIDIVKDAEIIKRQIISL